MTKQFMQMVTDINKDRSKYKYILSIYLGYAQ